MPGFACRVVDERIAGVLFVHDSIIARYKQVGKGVSRTLKFG